VPSDRRNAVFVEDLYDTYGALCYGLAYRMVNEEQLACTIVRDLFVAVSSGEAVFDPARGSVQTWLLGATHRSAVSALRRHRQLTSGGAKGLETLPILQTRGAVQRYLLELGYFGGHTQPEIATLTGMTLGTIKTLTMEALSGVGTRPSTPAPRRGLPVRALEVIRD
jgi:RNA polymerase sigma-70 factor, ECF subfamily